MMRASHSARVVAPCLAAPQQHTGVLHVAAGCHSSQHVMGKKASRRASAGSGGGGSGSRLVARWAAGEDQERERLDTAEQEVEEEEEEEEGYDDEYEDPVDALLLAREGSGTGAEPSSARLFAPRVSRAHPKSGGVGSIPASADRASAPGPSSGEEKALGGIKPIMSRKALAKIAAKGGEGSERGVVYVGYIPPKMTPLKIRRLLSAQKNAEVLRIYLAPEGIEALKARRKGARDKERKGDRGKRYTEGWVEFGDKRVAKRVAQKLHGTPMGGTRRSAHYEALWNLRYLSRFKWHHLTEEDRAARAESAQAFAAEVREAARERNFYASRVNQARAIEKRKRAEEREDGGPGSQADKKARKDTDEGASRRYFRQHAVVAKGGKKKGQEAPKHNAVLDTIFGT